MMRVFIKGRGKTRCEIAATSWLLASRNFTLSNFPLATRIFPLVTRTLLLKPFQYQLSASLMRL